MNRKLKSLLSLAVAFILIPITTNATEIAKFQLGDYNYTRTDSVDISSHQSWLKNEDFTDLRYLGIQSIIIKGTEGQYYENDYFDKHYSQTKSNELGIGIYHYSTYHNMETARAEAQYLINFLNKKNVPKNTLIINDLEDTKTYAGLTEYDVVLSTKIFFETLVQAGYTNVALYTYESYIYHNGVSSILGKYNTWIAQYIYEPTRNNNTEHKLAIQGYGAWQYSDRAQFKGNDIDANVDFNGLLTYRTNLQSGLNYNSYTGEYYYY